MRGTGDRITIIQLAGDFREASLRLAAGGRENYRAQGYTVEYVEQLAARAEVTTITSLTAEAYDVMLPSGVRAIGAGQTVWDPKAIIKLAEETRPNRIVLRIPDPTILRWIVRRRIPTLAMLADSFQARSFRDRLRRFVIVWLLNSKVVGRIGNHGRNASRQLAAAGVHAGKIIAWDYPAKDRPSDRVAKTEASGKKLIYVGTLTEAKGVDDLILAVQILRSEGNDATLDLIGSGETDRLKKLVASLKLDAFVNFRGIVPNDAIIEEMRLADVVVVPSRHEYPEGLPLTIYEAFCSRTPLVASDHPMFFENVVHEESGLLFRAGDHGDLARQVSRLLSDRALYARLSTNSDDAWRRIQIPDTWGKVIDGWLESAAR